MARKLQTLLLGEDCHNRLLRSDVHSEAVHHHCIYTHMVCAHGLVGDISYVEVEERAKKEDESMSVKSSLIFKEYNVKRELHVYLNTMDGEYYLEDEKGCVRLPNREIAERIADAVKEV